MVWKRIALVAVGVLAALLFRVAARRSWVEPKWAQLVPLSALATRWRRLELAAWKGLLDGTRQRMAAAAHQVGHWVLSACLNAQPSGRCRKCDAGAPLKAQYLSFVLLHCFRVTID